MKPHLKAPTLYVLGNVLNPQSPPNKQPLIKETKIKKRRENKKHKTQNPRLV